MIDNKGVAKSVSRVPTRVVCTCSRGLTARSFGSYDAGRGDFDNDPGSAVGPESATSSNPGSAVSPESATSNDPGRAVGPESATSGCSQAIATSAVGSNGSGSSCGVGHASLWLFAPALTSACCSLIQARKGSV